MQICSDCQTVRLSAPVKIEGEQAISPNKKEVQKVYGSAEIGEITDEIWQEMSGMKILALPPKKPITLESRFSDLRQTFMGRILFNAVLSVAKKQMKKAKKMPDGAEKDNAMKGAFFMKRILESNSILSMSMCAGGTFPYHFALGFVNLANGRLIKGIKCFCTKIKAPALPKYKEENK